MGNLTEEEITNSQILNSFVLGTTKDVEPMAQDIADYVEERFWED